MPSAEFIILVGILKTRLKNEKDPRRCWILNRQINRLLDRENARLYKLIFETVTRIEQELEKIDRSNEAALLLQKMCNF